MFLPDSVSEIADNLSDICGLNAGYPQVETPKTPDEPDAPEAKSIPARPWGAYPGVGCVECVGLLWTKIFDPDSRWQFPRSGHWCSDITEMK